MFDFIMSLFGMGKMSRERVIKMNQGFGGFEGKDLSGLDLSGIAFVQKNFKGTNLSDANLKDGEFTQCELHNADLTRVDFRGRELCQTEFNGSKMHKVNLTENEVSQCEFKGADLTGAKLDGAKFSQCDFDDAILKDVTTDGVEFSQCDGVEGLKPEQQYKSIWDMDDEEGLAYCKEKLTEISEKIGGSIKVNDDDEVVTLSGKKGERPFRIKVGYDNGSFDIQMRHTNRIGTLALHQEAGKTATEDDEDWDDVDASEKRHFIAKDVYIEEYPDDFEAKKALLEQLPSSLTSKAADLLVKHSVSILDIDDTTIDIRFDNDFMSYDHGRIIATSIEFLEEVAGIFESGDQDVSARPRVFIQGRAVDPSVFNNSNEESP